MKKFIKHALSKEELSKTKGGITREEFDEVLQHLKKNDIEQYNIILETYSMFGHGGTVEMQFEES